MSQRIITTHFSPTRLWHLPRGSSCNISMSWWYLASICSCCGNASCGDACQSGILQKNGVPRKMATDRNSSKIQSCFCPTLKLKWPFYPLLQVLSAKNWAILAFQFSAQIPSLVPQTWWKSMFLTENIQGIRWISLQLKRFVWELASHSKFPMGGLPHKSNMSNIHWPISTICVT